MIINKDRTISDIQKEFNTAFPGLRLAFYYKGHKHKEGSPVRMEYPDHLTIGEIQTVAKSGDFELNPNMSVAEMEQQMAETLSLHVQVFRRSNELWLQTTSTDNWTLEVQNSKGLHSMRA